MRRKNGQEHSLSIDVASRGGGRRRGRRRRSGRVGAGGVAEAFGLFGMTTTGGVDGREFAEAVDEVDFDELHGGLVEGLLEDVAVDEGELAGGDGGDVDDDGGGELGLGVEGVVEGAFVAVDEVAGPERVDAAGAGAGVGDGDLDDAVLDDQEGVEARGLDDGISTEGAAGRDTPLRGTTAVLLQQLERPAERGVFGVHAIEPGRVAGLEGRPGRDAVRQVVADAVRDQGADPAPDQTLGAGLGLLPQRRLDSVEDVRQELEQVARDRQQFTGRRRARRRRGARERVRHRGFQELRLPETFAGFQAMQAQRQLAVVAVFLLLEQRAPASSAEEARLLRRRLDVVSSFFRRRLLLLFDFLDVAGPRPQRESVRHEDVALQQHVEARVDFAGAEDHVASLQRMGRVQRRQEIAHPRGRDAPEVVARRPAVRI
mmetsp:Transcript_28842/g.88235  ORF Transcript_28842/g.88235 Transcript_28842/m.88235 type:complete len:430 (-) Transcript_28842:331-1620(-)